MCLETKNIFFYNRTQKYIFFWVLETEEKFEVSSSNGTVCIIQFGELSCGATAQKDESIYC